jgi:hypothetical protein
MPSPASTTRSRRPRRRPGGGRVRGPRLRDQAPTRPARPTGCSRLRRSRRT